MAAGESLLAQYLRADRQGFPVAHRENLVSIQP
jgi:hypothetical protein